MPFRLIWLFLVVAVLPIRSLGQKSPCTFTLQGRVLEAGSGVPIADVLLLLPELQKGAYTDEEGRFAMEGLCSGTHTLIARHLNHEEKRETVQLQTALTQRVLYMSCHTDTLHQAVVKGARLHWEDVTVTHKLQGTDLFLSSGGSLGKALEKVNGVYSLSTGSQISKPVIRGLHSNRVLILNNELRQEGQQWGNEHAPEIDPYLAQDIEVVKGAQSIRYGSDVIGGIILVNPKAMKLVDHLQGDLNLSAFSNGRAGATSLSVEGLLKPLPGFSWRTQGTFRQAGNARSPDYFLKNTGMKEINYSAAVGYARDGWDAELFYSSFHTNLGILSASHIGNLTDLYTAFARERPLDSAGFSYRIGFPYQDVLHRLVKSKWNLKLGSWGTLHMLYGYQQNIRKEFDKTLQTKLPDGSYKPALHFDLRTQQADVYLQHRAVKRLEGGLGANACYQVNSYYGNYFIPNYEKLNGGLYWVEKWHRQAFSLEAGLRADINTFSIHKWQNQVLIQRDHSYRGLAASVAARYQFPLLTLHLNGGTAWRAPFVNELYSDGVHHSAASYEIGDPRLVPERNYNVSLTADFNYRKKVDMELSIYNNYIRNYINLQPSFPATLTLRGAFPTFRYSQVDATFYGAEFSATTGLYKSIHLHTRANLTLARNLNTGGFLVGIPPGRLEAELDVPLSRRTTTQLNWNLGASYTMKQNRVADSADYVPAPPAYFLVQSHVSGQGMIVGWPLEWQVGVSNLLNTRYRDYMNRNRYFADETGRSIFLRLHYVLQAKSNKQILLKN